MLCAFQADLCLVRCSARYEDSMSLERAVDIAERSLARGMLEKLSVIPTEELIRNQRKVNSSLTVELKTSGGDKWERVVTMSSSEVGCPTSMKRWFS